MADVPGDAALMKKHKTLGSITVKWIVRKVQVGVPGGEAEPAGLLTLTLIRAVVQRGSVKTKRIARSKVRVRCGEQVKETQAFEDEDICWGEGVKDRKGHDRPRKQWKFGIYCATDLPRIELVDASNDRVVAARDLY
eukprot:gene2919-3585_t